MVSASSTWPVVPSRTAACQRSKPATSSTERAARARRKAAGIHDQPRALQQADAVIAGGAVDLLHRLVAESALGGVHDALEGEAVLGGDRDAKIRHRVADLGALVEARAADHAIGQADGQEAVLEGAHLEAGAHQDRHAVRRDRVETAGALLQRLDLLADPARLLLAVPVADQADALALRQIGPERLAEAALVGGDHAGGGGEDMRSGAVVLLQTDDLRAGEVLLEAQDVADLGAAPAVDRLVVVADAGDVAVAAGQQPQPEVLGDVGVLVFVDEDVAEPALVGLEDVGMRLQDRHDMQQQVAEVAGVECLQPVLVLRVKLGTAVVEGAGVSGGHLLRAEGAVLPAVDERGQQPRWPTLVVDVGGLDQLAQQAELVVSVEDGEVRFQPDKFGVAAEDPRRERMEGAEPGHALDDAADQLANAGFHFPRRLVGEGDGEDLVRPCPAGVQKMRDAGGERPSLARARAGKHQYRSVERLDGGALVGVQGVEIGRGPRGHGPGGQRGRRGLEGLRFVGEGAAHGRAR